VEGCHCFRRFSRPEKKKKTGKRKKGTLM